MSVIGKRLSRRALLAGAAAGSIAGTAAALAPRGLAWGLLAAETRPAPPLEEFGYDQITISGEQQLAQQTNVRSILLGFDEDSLLKPYREMSAKPGSPPSPGASLGGWYAWNPDYNPHHDAPGFAPGHAFGQWVSAMARLHAATGDAALGERAVRLNGLLSQCITEGFFAQTRFPAYTYDKLVCGLKDAHRLAGDSNAFAILDKVTAAALPQLPGHAVDREIQYRMGKDGSFMWDESYTMPENLYLASDMMADPAAHARYRSMADAYLDDATYFAPLARGENVMADKHAYSYVNAVCSAMQCYLTTGSAMHLEAGRRAFAMVEEQSFATGGWGPDELLRKPGEDEVASSLGNTHRGFETPCGSYAHMKLTRYLLRATRDGHYGDSMERVMLNTVLGAMPLEPDGHAFYYADYNVVARRAYFDSRWPCCAGSLPQVVADYGINTYLREPGGPGQADAVWVNLYQPSELRWREGAVSLSIEQTGAYLESGEIRLKITASQPAAFALRLRMPAWGAEGCELQVNGVPQRVATGDSASGSVSDEVGAVKGFVTLHRTWRTGDLVDLRLPLALRLEALPGHPETVALLWGPLVLFAVRESGDVGTLVIARDALLGARRTGPRSWLVKSGSVERTFVPFTDLGERAYSTYVSTLAV